MVKDISYKNQLGAETVNFDYDSIVALQSLAVTNAAKNISDYALLADPTFLLLKLVITTKTLLLVVSVLLNILKLRLLMVLSHPYLGV